MAVTFQESSICRRYACQWQKMQKSFRDTKRDHRRRTTFRTVLSNLLGVCASGDPIPDNIVVCDDGFHIIDPRGDVVWKKSNLPETRHHFMIRYMMSGNYYSTSPDGRWYVMKCLNLVLMEAGIELSGNVFSLRPKESSMTDLFRKVQSEFLQVSLENGLQDQFCFGDNLLLRLAFITATHFLADTSTYGWARRA